MFTRHLKEALALEVYQLKYDGEKGDLSSFLEAMGQRQPLVKLKSAREFPEWRGAFAWHGVARKCLGLLLHHEYQVINMNFICSINNQFRQ